jgi:hypothetical protein
MLTHWKEMSEHGSTRPLEVPGLGVACAFRPEFLDFEHGIHVGNLNENERITRILKLALEARYGQSFVTERWGRGVYWKWIGFLARANRSAKPVSSDVSFGCSKFFLTVDTEERSANFGLQIERGFVKAPPEDRQFELKEDWDWHRLIAALKPKSVVAAEIERLVRREGFLLHAGSWGGESVTLSGDDYPGPLRLRKILEAAPGDHWAGFQLYYSMGESDVKQATGLDLVESMLAVYGEVVPVMNASMQIELVAR